MTATASEARGSRHAPAGRVARQRRRRQAGALGAHAELARQATQIEYQSVVAIGQPAQQIGQRVECGAKAADRAECRGKDAGHRSELRVWHFERDLTGQIWRQRPDGADLRLTHEGLVEIGCEVDRFVHALIPQTVRLPGQHAELLRTDLAPGLTQAEDRVGGGRRTAAEIAFHAGFERAPACWRSGVDA